ncbi:MAG: hypothetical protein OEW08_04460 [Gammaproteobacteria bacterium]|nr:hypothetical protein [Gammaproteobacteria bacterium]
MANSFCATVNINGKKVSVVCTKAATKALALRTQPLIVELELYFSCLIKKFVHFHETAPDRPLVIVNDKLSIYFRTVTSTACSFEVAARLGRQPEVEINNDVVHRLAPKRVNIDYKKGTWVGTFEL